MLVVIRADATLLSGVGHAMRCLALAEEFATSGDQIHWIGDLASQPWLVDKVKRVATSITEPAPSEPEQANQVLGINPDLTVVDSYELGEAFCFPVQRSLNALVAIVDSTSHLTPADLYVIPGVDPVSPDKSKRTQIFQGAQYVLIRKELRQLKRQMRPSTEQKCGASNPRRVAVLLGGTDVAELTPNIVKALLSLNIALNVHAVSRSMPSIQNSEPVDPRVSSTVTWWRPGQEIYPHIVDAHLVISGAGVSSWEFLYLGLPLALIQVADNQVSNYQWMTSRGHALGMGSSFELQDTKTLRNVLRNLLRLDVKSMTDQGSVVDGLGAQRVVNAAHRLVKSIHPKG